MERVEADGAGPVDRGVEADRAGDVRRARLEPRRRGQVGGLVERHLVDHRTAALVGRHRVEDFGPGPQRADPGRAVDLVRRENVEIAIERGDVDRQARRRLAAVEQQLRADLVREPRGAAGVEDRAEHVRDMGESDQLVRFGEHRLGRVEVDAAVVGQRADVDVRTDLAGDDLPRHDVRMMLERRQQDAVAGAQVGAAPAVRDEVDRLGRAAREHQFGLAAADQRRSSDAGRLEALGHRRRALVHAAMDGGVVAAIGAA